MHDHIDTTTATGRLTFNIFASLAEFEREIIRERTKAGLGAARARGKKGGRLKGLSPENLQLALTSLDLHDTGNAISEIANRLQIPKATCYRYIKHVKKLKVKSRSWIQAAKSYHQKPLHCPLIIMILARAQNLSLAPFTMTDEQVKYLIQNELSQKTLGVTEQYLEIHEVFYEEGELKISRIDREKEEGLIIAYLPIKEEYFCFAIYIDERNNSIQNIGTESRNQVLLRATSNDLTCHELQSMTKLKATKSINKGDFKHNTALKYTYSVIDLEPNPEPDEFEDKLEKLLTFLEQDTKGIHALAKVSKIWVSVTMDFHYGNQLLGNTFISLENIKRLGALNLAIDCDFAAWGNPFK